MAPVRARRHRHGDAVAVQVCQEPLDAGQEVRLGKQPIQHPLSLLDEILGLHLVLKAEKNLDLPQLMQVFTYGLVYSVEGTPPCQIKQVKSTAKLETP